MALSLMVTVQGSGLSSCPSCIDSSRSLRSSWTSVVLLMSCSSKASQYL